MPTQINIDTRVGGQWWQEGSRHPEPLTLHLVMTFAPLRRPLATTSRTLSRVDSSESPEPPQTWRSIGMVSGSANAEHEDTILDLTTVPSSDKRSELTALTRVSRGPSVPEISPPMQMIQDALDGSSVFALDRINAPLSPQRSGCLP